MVSWVGAFPGGYWDEAWFGLTSSLDPSVYMNNQLPVSREFYPAFSTVQSFYTGSSHLGSELYVPEPTTIVLHGLGSSLLLLGKMAHRSRP